jgi:hypothetical protein
MNLVQAGGWATGSLWLGGAALWRVLVSTVQQLARTAPFRLLAVP